MKVIRPSNSIKFTFLNFNIIKFSCVISIWNLATLSTIKSSSKINHAQINQVKKIEQINHFRDMAMVLVSKFNKSCFRLYDLHHNNAVMVKNAYHEIIMKLSGQKIFG